MSTFDILLIVVGVFAILCFVASVVVTSLSLKSRRNGTDEVTYIRFAEEAILSFIFLVLFLIPWAVIRSVSWIGEGRMRKKLECNLAVIHCCSKSNTGFWTLGPVPEIRFWYDAEHVLYQNRWRVK